ncbi:MAG TPA: 4-hydroxythreonine-4-phosphate dehydrogenase PdxA [Limnochordales bacterium]
MTEHRPVLAITMGDAAGIGPEIIVKALARPEVQRACRPLVVGDAAVLERHLRFWPAGQGGRRPAVRPVAGPEEVGEGPPEAIPVLQPGPPLGPVEPGRLSPEAGRGAVTYVKAAAALARERRVAGIVTAPLNKEAMRRAGFAYPGHTELLAEEFGVTRYSLVLAARGLFVFHVTTHVSLRQALDLLTRERVLGQIRLAHLLAEALGQGQEPVAVAGLNPHAGEGGLFGTEERDIIGPAVEAARLEGIPAVGPRPADVIFPKAARGEYRYVVAMYHDQGHAVFKSLFFDEGVNVTVGLPVIRTSVDHGTAFDIAGKGVAREASLVAAIDLAARLGPKWEPIWRQAQALG